MLTIDVLDINKFDEIFFLHEQEALQDDATGKTMGECWIFISSSLSRRQHWPHGYVTDTRTRGAAADDGPRPSERAREREREKWRQETTGRGRIGADPGRGRIIY